MSLVLAPEFSVYFCVHSRDWSTSSCYLQGSACQPHSWALGGMNQGQAATLIFLPTKPTVHFAEDTLIPREDGESEEGQPEAPWQLPSGRQRLIRKDTPHYKKHFKISKLPQPEAVVALLQGVQTDREGTTGGWHNGPHTPWAPQAQEEEEEENRVEEGETTMEEEDDDNDDDVDKEEAVASAPSVKVRHSYPVWPRLRWLSRLLWTLVGLSLEDTQP